MRSHHYFRWPFQEPCCSRMTSRGRLLERVSLEWGPKGTDQARSLSLETTVARTKAHAQKDRVAFAKATATEAGLPAVIPIWVGFNPRKIQFPACCIHISMKFCTVPGNHVTLKFTNV